MSAPAYHVLLGFRASVTLSSSPAADEVDARLTAPFVTVTANSIVNSVASLNQIGCTAAVQVPMPVTASGVPQFTVLGGSPPLTSKCSVTTTLLSTRVLFSASKTW